MDINVRNFNGDSPLLVSCSNNCEEISTFLISQGADVNLGNHTGRTPLFYACLNESFRTVENLVRKGADVNAVTNDYKTALCMSLGKKNKELCQTLIRNGLHLEDLSFALHLRLHSTKEAIKRNCIFLSTKETQLLEETTQSIQSAHDMYLGYLNAWQLSSVRVLRAVVDYERNKRDRLAFLDFLYACGYWNVDDSADHIIDDDDSNIGVAGFIKYKKWLREVFFGNKDLCRLVLRYLG